MAHCSHVLMVLALASLQMGGGHAVRYAEIDPAKIRLRVKEKPDNINVTWKNPNKKYNDWCYESHLQYKSQCDPDWLDPGVLESFNFTPQFFGKGSGRNYSFRVRMRYRCLNRSWSSWTAEVHWWKGDILGSCFKSNSKLHLVIIAIPAIFFLVILAIQKQVRRLVLPKVPDPKHMYEHRLKIDQSQLEKTFKYRCIECTNLKIEIVRSEKEKEEEERIARPADADDAEPTALAAETATRGSACPLNSTALTLEQGGYVCW